MSGGHPRSWIERRGVPFLIFYACAVAAGLALFAMRGIDANWDLRNYHLAGPYLALSPAPWDHVVPASLQTYFPSLVNYPTYFGLTRLGPWTWRIVSIAWQALFWPLMLGTFWTVLRRETPDAVSRRPVAILILLLGLSGVAGMSLSVLGTSFQDLTLAVFIAAAIARALHVGFEPNMRRGVEIALLMGVAVGLKSTSIVTAAPFAIAFYAVTLACHPRRGAVIAEFALFALVAVVCVAAVSGHWMLEVYRATGNPAFPYANGIFRSPLAAPVNWSDDRFVPASLRAWIGRPIRLAIGPSYLISEEPFRDIRYALVLYGLVPLALVSACVVGRSRALFAIRHAPATTCLAIFFVMGVLLWAKLFSIGRYMPVYEILAGFLILRAALAISGRWGGGIAAIAMGAHLSTAMVPDWGSLRHTADGRRLFAPDRPVLDRALVVLDGTPMGYVLPYLGQNARTILRAPFTASDSYYAGRVNGLLSRPWPGGIWYLAEPVEQPGKAAYLSGYGLAATRSCIRIPTWYTLLRACRLQPVSGHAGPTRAKLAQQQHDLAPERMVAGEQQRQP